MPRDFDRDKQFKGDDKLDDKQLPYPKLPKGTPAETVAAERCLSWPPRWPHQYLTDACRSWFAGTTAAHRAHSHRSRALTRIVTH
jgi:hypothetical protein